MLTHSSIQHSTLHSITSNTLLSLTPLFPILSSSPKIHIPQPFDGYFLDEVVTFRKKGTDNDQKRLEQPPRKEQKRKESNFVPPNDPIVAEQRAKTQLFEYSEEVIRKQFDSLQVKPNDAERLPNLSTQLSAFKQQQNSFLKDLLSKKCKEKLLRYNYPSIKSISTQISCEKVWLKHKKNIAINSRNSTEERSNMVGFQSPLSSYSQTEQLTKIGCMPQQRLKLYRKAIVMSLNHKNQTQNAEQRLWRIHLNQFKKERYRKELKCATASHQQINQHPISLILHCKNRDTNDFIQKLRQRNTNSQNGISSIKSLPKDKVTRINSTNSDYLKQEKRRLMEGLNIMNLTNKQSDKKLKQLHNKNHVQTVEGLEIKTKKKIMSIFRKIKEQRVYAKSSFCSPESLSSSIKINSKENLKKGSFNLNVEATKSMKANSEVLKIVKEDVKINRRNIINSLKIFAECKKSRNVRDLFSNQMHRFSSSSGVLLRDRHTINE